MKRIGFPVEELEQLKGKSRIVTTRVSREYGCYDEGEILQTPWGEWYVVAKIEKVSDIKDHPYYNELTQEQVRLLSGYKKIKVLTLKKVKTS